MSSSLLRSFSKAFERSADHGSARQDFDTRCIAHPSGRRVVGAKPAPAPGAVRKDIAEALDLLAQQPGIGSIYEGAKTKNVRRPLVGRIRYFKVNDAWTLG